MERPLDRRVCVSFQFAYALLYPVDILFHHLSLINTHALYILLIECSMYLRHNCIQLLFPNELCPFLNAHRVATNSSQNKLSLYAKESYFLWKLTVVLVVMVKKGY